MLLRSGSAKQVPVTVSASIDVTRAPIVLLPGLDGTGKLFERFVASAPDRYSITQVALPVGNQTYQELAERVAVALPQDPVALIAESFSGPLAVAIAERHAVAALVFCNSFVVAPRWRALRWLVHSAVFRRPVPAFMLRRYMLGRAADDGLVKQVTQVIASVPADVIASRLHSVLTVDCTREFSRISAPTLYVRSTNDRLLPESAWQKMAALRPVECARVSGPHLVLQVNPVDAWGAIAPFLHRLPRR